MINWNNPEDKVSNHFTVKECTHLPQWGVCHIPSEEEQANLIKTAQKMDIVRDFIGKPISIHCWIRPILNNPASEHNGQDYNVLVGGATHSAHKIGLAVDFDCGEDCDVTRAALLPKLEEWGLRMEDHHGPWVHLDLMPPNPNRYFIP